MKNTKQKKSPKIEKEEVKKISADEFDSVMKTILSAPPEEKKKRNWKNKSNLFLTSAFGWHRLRRQTIERSLIVSDYMKNQ